jgi:hypothetical protein
MKIICIFLFVLIIKSTFSQSDTNFVKNYSNKLVLSSDIGFNNAPFSLFITDSKNTKTRFKYRNNISPFFGFGLNYQWFSFRIGSLIPGNIKSEEKYGKTAFVKLGAEFRLKKFFFDLEYTGFQGFYINNLSEIDNNLPDNHLITEVKTKSTYINSWYFHNKNFRISTFNGKTSTFNRNIFSWYIKSSFNAYSVENNIPMLPISVYDPSKSITYVRKLKAIDFGLIPGIAYSAKFHRLNFGFLIGIGCAIQDKSYETKDIHRNFIGLAPRYDVRFSLGYNYDRWFLRLRAEFDNKTIAYPDLYYRQTYSVYKIVYGYRFEMKNRKIIDFFEKINKKIEN